MPSSQLWIVATPIGNPGDLSPRARLVLEEADIILAEDTRRAARLFAETGIKYKKIISFHEHNEHEQQGEILDFLQGGQTVALVSDAGTPLLSDPGYSLVRACREAGIRISSLPGPFAPAVALSAAGIAPIPFTFLGFLPRSQGEQRRLFASYISIPGSLVFFERKNRLMESLKIAFEILGDRKLAICRELTKIHEEFIIGALKDYERMAASLLGEITVIVGPPEKGYRTPPAEVAALISKYSLEGMKTKILAKQISAECQGWTASEVYSLANSRE